MNIVPEIEVAAANRVPAIAWRYEQMVGWVRGRPASKRFSLAVLVHTATLNRCPNVECALRTVRGVFVISTDVHERTVIRSWPTANPSWRGCGSQTSVGEALTLRSNLMLDLCEHAAHSEGPG